MGILLITALSAALLFILISTQTLWLHPRPRADLLEKPYTVYPDLWLKKEGNTRLVIALHGMYSHPQTFQEFGEMMLEEGWDLYAPVLPNSAHSAGDLKNQESYQWEETLRAAFHKCLANGEGYRKIVLLGHSQGGAVAMVLAPALAYLDGLALVAAPLHMLKKGCGWTRWMALYFSGFLYFVIPNHGGGKEYGSQKKELAAVEDVLGGEGYFHTLTLHSMLFGLRKLRRRLHTLDLPLFLAYEKNDETVDFKTSFKVIKHKVSSSIIKECITETPKSLHPLSKKHRLFSYLPVKGRLFTSLKAFLKERS